MIINDKVDNLNNRMVYGNKIPTGGEFYFKIKTKNKLNLVTNHCHSSPYLQNQSLPMIKFELKH